MTTNDGASAEALPSTSDNIEPVREWCGKLGISGVLGDTVDEQITDSGRGNDGRSPDLPVRFGPVSVASVESKTVGACMGRVPVGLHGVQRSREEVETEELVTIKVVSETPGGVLAVGEGTEDIVLV